MDVDVLPARLAPDGERSGDVPVLPARLAPDGERSGDVPVLAQDDAEPADTGTTEEPPIDIGGSSDVPVLAQSDGLIGDIADDDPLLSASTGTEDAITETRTGWRVERFGPKAPDGKGRYWQWRRGRGKNREAAYGGKIENENSGYWQRHSASTGTTDTR